MSIKFSLAAQGGKHTKKKEGEAGFTLLEVLLALTLTGRGTEQGPTSALSKVGGDAGQCLPISFF
jgi:prepilin-type N-terminal cleavage/methylation domain-containing protein